MEHTYIPLTPTPTSLPPILLPPHPSRHSPVLFCPTLSCTSWHILLIYLSWSTTGVRWARWRMRRSGTFSPFKLSSKTGSGCSRNKPLRVMTPWSKPRDKWGQRCVWVFTALHCSTYCTALLYILHCTALHSFAISPSWCHIIDLNSKSNCASHGHSHQLRKSFNDQRELALKEQKNLITQKRQHQVILLASHRLRLSHALSYALSVAISVALSIVLAPLIDVL